MSTYSAANLVDIGSGRGDHLLLNLGSNATDEEGIYFVDTEVHELVEGED